MNATTLVAVGRGLRPSHHRTHTPDAARPGVASCLPRPVAILALAIIAPVLHAASPAVPAADPGLPFVYTAWEQLTTADGLPNDHIFALRSDPARACIWIGTENGLARFDKKTRAITSWREQDGLPWRVVTAIEVDPRTGDLWLGLFGGGLARFSAGRFDHFSQMNSGLVNDVVYAITTEGDHVWCATTAGASRYNVKADTWDIFTEKNAPMEEIWNYNISANETEGKVHLAVWGSGVLEYDIKSGNWKTYLDPDGEMEIDLYRDDGNVHVIVTGAQQVERTLWISSYFGCARYDGRHWRGYFDHDSGLPSNFTNNIRARSAQECWFATDKGAGVCTDAATDTWVTYTADGRNRTGKAVIKRDGAVISTVDTGYSIPQNFVICVDFDGADVWVGTSKGVGHGIGKGYYPRLRSADAPAAANPRATP